MTVLIRGFRAFLPVALAAALGLFAMTAPGQTVKKQPAATNPASAGKGGSSAAYSWTGAGEVVGCQWSHRSGQLALLLRSHTTLDRLVVLDPRSGKVESEFPFPRGIHPACLGWERGDQSILVSVQRAEDDIVLYRANLKIHTNRPVFENLERPFLKIFNICCDGDSPLWALSCVGEGHPDVAIYNGEKLVLQTDVYPGTIGAADWQNGKLRCEATTRIDLGLTREERKANPKFTPKMAEGLDDMSWYEIDPVTAKARSLTKVPDDDGSVSPDGALRFKVSPAAGGKTTVSFSPAR